MPGYGVVDENSGKGLLPWSWATERLLKTHNYWISTARPDGRPHTMVVWGVWLDDRFYFSTGKESRKARNLSANPNCVVCTDRADEAVVVEGVAAEVKDKSLVKKVLKIYEPKYKWEMDGSEGPFFAVTPKVVFGLIELELTSTATRWTFES
jgi:nitroimidazol reductase NimA-like FMN-containing flavoprotein (pyridoxamine 5'-phosphate oxidase superfamily)